ncbi:MAG: hypothetical protein EBS92_06880, partial [Proteobacteria bacterium]|nr:hypothetical protein [Pseudomonadota bacterium]
MFVIVGNSSCFTISNSASLKYSLVYFGIKEFDEIKVLEFVKYLKFSVKILLISGSCKKYSKIVNHVNEWEKKLSTLKEEDLPNQTKSLKERYQKGEPLDSLLPEAYALVKVACQKLHGTEVHVSGYNQRW